MSPGIPLRFAIRQVGATWTVYTWHDLEPARVGGIVQIGLDRDMATTVAERLNAEILRDRGQRSEPRPSLASARELAVASSTEAA